MSREAWLGLVRIMLDIELPLPPREVFTPPPPVQPPVTPKKTFIAVAVQAGTPHVEKEFVNAVVQAGDWAPPVPRKYIDAEVQVAETPHVEKKFVDAKVQVEVAPAPTPCLPLASAPVVTLPTIEREKQGTTLIPPGEKAQANLATPPARAKKHVVQPPPLPPKPAARALVLHAAPTHRKLGEMRRWLEEDNKGVVIIGARWLLQEGRRLGKATSSLVIYLSSPKAAGKLRMGRKLFRTTRYEWSK